MVRVLGTGTITNFATGFSAENSAGSFVKFVTVTANCPFVSLGFDITASSSQWKLEANVVREPGNTSAGIVLESGANDCDLVRNDVNDTISVDSNNNNIINNIGNDNAGGIGVTGNNNEIHANTTDNNSNFGILLTSGASGNSISGNTSLNNTPYDMEDDNTNCGTNKWRGNKFKYANMSCIH
jgi:hypothetical protein